MENAVAEQPLTRLAHFGRETGIPECTERRRGERTQQCRLAASGRAGEERHPCGPQKLDQRAAACRAYSVMQPAQHGLELHPQRDTARCRDFWCSGKAASGGGSGKHGPNDMCERLVARSLIQDSVRPSTIQNCSEGSISLKLA